MKNKTVLAMLCGALMGLAGCNDEHDASQPRLNDSISQPTLVAFAKLPVDTYASGPDSGKAVKGANGIYPPFKGQPVQGFSAALKNKDGSYMVMADNGFGTQDNSADFLLRIYKLSPDFKNQKPRLCHCNGTKLYSAARSKQARSV